MSGIKTLSCLVALLASPVVANQASPDPQLRFFASCTGRLSALIEYQWTHDTAVVDQTIAQRNAMVTLITAVMPPDAGRDVLLMRVEAKHAQAALLQRATRAATPAEAKWAMQRADALLQDCTSVLLPVS